MKLHNTLTRQVENFEPINTESVRMYSCGPTVYDHIHIGNLSAFIYADTLRRVIQSAGMKIEHVMNFTDVDDKTIQRSAEKYPDEAPETALKKLTDEYSSIFLHDMEAIGNDVTTVQFISATDSIVAMRDLIRELHKDGFAYITDDGVYFSIQKYRDSGKKYGQLTDITDSSTSEARIQNDEYDKESAHDFALWKKRKNGEPSWEFELDGQDLGGRPGWHIECSAMSVAKLGQPFDIHTGGIDLLFPHHENEIAQSTAGKGNTYAKYFVHNEHLLVDGKKMSKSLNNFYTLRDVQERGYSPQAFRLMVLQSHYSKQSNFSWDNLEAAQNRLKNWQAAFDTKWQVPTDSTNTENQQKITSLNERILASAQDNISTPEAITEIEAVIHLIENGGLTSDLIESIDATMTIIHKVLGIELVNQDITPEQKQLILDRQKARDNKDWARSDELRDLLLDQGLAVRDTDSGPIWSRV